MNISVPLFFFADLSFFLLFAHLCWTLFVVFALCFTLASCSASASAQSLKECILVSNFVSPATIVDGPRIHDLTFCLVLFFTSLIITCKLVIFTDTNGTLSIYKDDGNTRSFACRGPLLWGCGARSSRLLEFTTHEGAVDFFGSRPQPVIFLFKRKRPRNDAIS